MTTDDNGWGPIETAELEAARRRLCRDIAATIMSAMAYRDASFADIAETLSDEPHIVRARYDRLCDGDEISLGEVADFSRALGCRLEIQVRPLPEPPA